MVEKAPVRALLAGVGILALGYGAWRGMDSETSGVTVAASFAIAILLLIVAIGGQLPASLKVGDVSVELYAQAKAEGVRQGAKLAATAAMGVDPSQVTASAKKEFPDSQQTTSSVTAALAALHTAAEVVNESARSDPDKVREMRDQHFQALSRV